MKFSIIPCLKSFDIDNNNVCNLCRQKILTENEVNEVKKRGKDEEICVRTSITNVSSSYFGNPLRIFTLSLLFIFGSSLFILDVKAQDTINKMKSELNDQNINSPNFKTISGKIIDKNNEELPFANIYLTLNGSIISGVTSDFDGNYKLTIDQKINDSDILILNIRYIGYRSIEEIIDVNKGEILVRNYQLINDEDIIIVGLIIDEREKLIDPFNTGTTKFSRQDITRSPYRD
ncbi:MAG: carboxypeptidase-like regulatory domain-containing protein [Flavobacteriales bacterium]|nr:carboxypeptidase-like regulatory domain-containing protein [Flavobacteriales bacterium]